MFIIDRFGKVIVETGMLVFICGAVIFFYNVRIEQGFFSVFLVRDLGSANDSLSKEDLLKQLENKTVVSCKDGTFRLLGLSRATIKTGISI